MSKFPRPIRKSLALLTALSGAILLTGCGGLPMSGTPTEFAIEVPTREPIGQAGSGPQQDSSPGQLIQDFLRASAAGSFDDYATARSYLLPATADVWRPTSKVVVFPTEKIPEAQVVSEGESSAVVSLEVPTSAVLDSTGVLNQLVETATTSLEFKLAKDSEGQWRIASLSDGLTLSQSAFQTAFGQYNLYFPSQDSQALIADPRWVPRLRTASHLVKGLLQGPSDVIKSAVQGAFGSGLSLPTGGVEIADRIAYVDLVGTLPSDPDARRLLNWQILQTLKQVSAVDDSVVSINGVYLDRDDLPSGPDYALDRLVAVEDGEVILGNLASAQVVVDSDSLTEQPIMPAIGPLTDSPIAWVDESGSVINIRYEPDMDPVRVDLEDVSWPSIDRWGNVWTTSNGVVQVINVDGDVTPLEIDEFDGAVDSVKVTVDGSRVAFLVNQQGIHTGWLATLKDGAQSFGLTSFAEVPQLTGDLLDIAWSNSTTLVGLTSEGVADQVDIILTPRGGWLQQATAPTESRWVTGSDEMGIIVQTGEQESYQKGSATWRAIGATYSWISTPG